MRTTNQSGFSAVEFLIVAVVVAAVGFVGYGVYSRQSNQTALNSISTTPSTISSQSPTAGNTSAAPTITSTAGLDQAAATLNQNDPSGPNMSDSSQLDSQSNF